jgi:chloramphenicol 3-O phosphotransferase
VLADPWLAFGAGSFIEALPAKMQASHEGIVFAADGGISVGTAFRTLEAAWMDGIATMARAGARIIIDDVFLGGAASRQRWRKALAGLAVLWVGVRGDSMRADQRRARQLIIPRALNT